MYLLTWGAGNASISIDYNALLAGAFPVFTGHDQLFISNVLYFIGIGCLRLYIRGRQASLASGILILEWITSALFHLQYHDWGETLEQGPNHQLFLGRCSNMAVHCSGCVFTVCVFTAVFVRLYGLNAEHKFWVWVTILGHTSLHFHSISLCLAAQIILLQTAFWMRDNSSFFFF